MTEIETFDIVVLGGGKGGKTLAMDRAKAGDKVAVVERGLIGGSCINIACIPTKALVKSARVADMVAHAGAFGTRVESSSTDMAAVRARTASVVSGMVEINWQAFRASGLELVLGWGRFVAPRVIEAASDEGMRRLTADRIYLDLGTKATIPPVPGLAESMPLTHVEALALDRLPAKLVILGGGYIGMEMAQAFRRFGSAVTIVEQGSQLASREDPDAAAAVRSLFEAEGIEIILDAHGPTVEGRSGDQVRIRLADGRSIEGSDLLVAAGRTPMTDGIGLDIAGVQRDDRGFIRVDERLQTTAAGIWALGEAAGSPMFTHVALDDYRVIKSGLTGGNRTTAKRLIPYCVFIDPEFARVGLDEKSARREGITYRLAKLPMDAVPRARTLSEHTGFMKALVAADNDHILGFSMLGAEAGEVMTVVQMTMLGNLPFTALRDGIIAHPTLAEGLNMLFATVAAV
jgi:pyruvate/2-oxoglutarate dehydrogenase complex dihydrolipoamide dehydrogenase (E3) component